MDYTDCLSPPSVLIRVIHLIRSRFDFNRFRDAFRIQSRIKFKTVDARQFCGSGKRHLTVLIEQNCGVKALISFSRLGESISILSMAIFPFCYDVEVGNLNVRSHLGKCHIENQRRFVIVITAHWK